MVLKAKLITEISELNEEQKQELINYLSTLDTQYSSEFPQPALQ